MADPFVAEVRILPTHFTPSGWAFCDGQLLPISQNTALFSLLGTTYGGDGKSTFALPDLRGRAPMHPGRGPGLSNRSLGETGGAGTTTLAESQITAHAHAIRADAADPADVQAPSGAVVLARSQGGNAYQTNTAGLVAMAPSAVATIGGGQPHNNMQPYLTLSFCIALQGVFPPRS